jgi:uncharacterized protein (DUF433 family)
MTIQTAKHRIQLDLPGEQVQIMDALVDRLALRSRAELWRQAYAAFVWIVDEALSGRRVVSVDAETLAGIDRYKELSLAATRAPTLENYQYLVIRSHPWRRQPYLKGRNMTVGQLVATMQANDLSPEEAAEDLDLPLAQVREALAYYDLHRDLVDLELQEEASRVVAREPKARENLPG